MDQKKKRNPKSILLEILLYIRSYGQIHIYVYKSVKDDTHRITYRSAYFTTTHKRGAPRGAGCGGRRHHHRLRPPQGWKRVFSSPVPTAPTAPYRSNTKPRQPVNSDRTRYGWYVPGTGVRGAEASRYFQFTIPVNNKDCDVWPEFIWKKKKKTF